MRSEQTALSAITYAAHIGGGDIRSILKQVRIEADISYMQRGGDILETNRSAPFAYPHCTFYLVGVLRMQLGVSWFDGLLGLACLLAGLYHIGLLLAGRARFAHAAAHALMGTGMAAMFVPAADPLPQPVWVAIFLVVAAWFAAASIRAGSLLGDAGGHAVGAVAMLYMLLVHARGAEVTPGAVDPAHAHHGGSGAAAPTLLLSVIALGFAAWFISDVVSRLVRPAGGVPSALVSESVGAGTESGRAARHPVRAGVAWGAAVPDVVMSAAMAVMFLGMA